MQLLKSNKYKIEYKEFIQRTQDIQKLDKSTFEQKHNRESLLDTNIFQDVNFTQATSQVRSYQKKININKLQYAPSINNFKKQYDKLHRQIHQQIKKKKCLQKITQRLKTSKQSSNKQQQHLLNEQYNKLDNFNLITQLFRFSKSKNIGKVQKLERKHQAFILYYFIFIKMTINQFQDWKIKLKDKNQKFTDYILNYLKYIFMKLYEEYFQNFQASDNILKFIWWLIQIDISQSDYIDAINTIYKIYYYNSNKQFLQINPRNQKIILYNIFSKYSQPIKLEINNNIQISQKFTQQFIIDNFTKIKIPQFKLAFEFCQNKQSSQNIQDENFKQLYQIIKEYHKDYISKYTFQESKQSFNINISPLAYCNQIKKNENCQRKKSPNFIEIQFENVVKSLQNLNQRMKPSLGQSFTFFKCHQTNLICFVFSDQLSNLNQNIKQLKITNMEINKITHNLQYKDKKGTIKIVMAYLKSIQFGSNRNLSPKSKSRQFHDNKFNQNLFHILTHNHSIAQKQLTLTFTLNTFQLIQQIKNIINKKLIKQRLSQKYIRQLFFNSFLQITQLLDTKSTHHILHVIIYLIAAYTVNFLQQQIPQEQFTQERQKQPSLIQDIRLYAKFLLEHIQKYDMFYFQESIYQQLGLFKDFRINAELPKIYKYIKKFIDIYKQDKQLKKLNLIWSKLLICQNIIQNLQKNKIESDQQFKQIWRIIEQFQLFCKIYCLIPDQQINQIITLEFQFILLLLGKSIKNQKHPKSDLKRLFYRPFELIAYKANTKIADLFQQNYWLRLQSIKTYLSQLKQNHLKILFRNKAIPIPSERFQKQQYIYNCKQKKKENSCKHCNWPKMHKCNQQCLCPRRKIQNNQYECDDDCINCKIFGNKPNCFKKFLSLIKQAKEFFNQPIKDKLRQNIQKFYKRTYP